MQIVQLTATGDFEEALSLCKLLPPEDSNLRAAKEQSIQIRTQPCVITHSTSLQICWNVLEHCIAFVVTASVVGFQQSEKSTTSINTSVLPTSSALHQYLVSTSKRNEASRSCFSLPMCSAALKVDLHDEKTCKSFATSEHDAIKLFKGLWGRSSFM